MNDKYIIASKGCRNVEADGKVIGYEFDIRIPYYQGVPLSQVKYLKVTMDGEEVCPCSISVFAVSGEEFKLKEISTVSLYYWEYCTPLRVRVYKEGGLAAGKHTLGVNTAIDVIYAPTGFGTEVTADFEI